MQTDPIGILEAVVTAFELQDIETIASYFDDDADFAIFAPADQLRSGGSIKGRLALIRRLTSFLGDFDVLQFSARTFLPADEGWRAQIDYCFRHRLSGEKIDGGMRVVAAFKDGRIIQWREYQDASRIEAYLRLIKSFAPTEPDTCQ